MKKLLSIVILLLASSAHAGGWRTAIMADNAASVTSSAPVFVGGSSNGVNDGIGPNSSPNTVTLTKPAGTSTGALILLFSGVIDDTNTTTLTWPAGFTENANSIYVSFSGPYTVKVRFATKIAGSSEPSSYAITASAPAYTIHVGAIAVYSGVNSTTPIEAITATGYNTPGGYLTTHTAIGVGVTSGTANRVIVQVSGLRVDSGAIYTYASPSGYTSRFNYPVAANSYTPLSLSDYTDVAGTNTANAISSFIGNVGNNAGRWAYMLALKPQ